MNGPAATEAATAHQTAITTLMDETERLNKTISDLNNMISALQALSRKDLSDKNDLQMITQNLTKELNECKKKGLKNTDNITQPSILKNSNNTLNNDNPPPYSPPSDPSLVSQETIQQHLNGIQEYLVRIKYPVPGSNEHVMNVVGDSGTSTEGNIMNIIEENKTNNPSSSYSKGGSNRKYTFKYKQNKKYNGNKNNKTKKNKHKRRLPNKIKQKKLTRRSSKNIFSEHDFIMF